VGVRRKQPSRQHTTKPGHSIASKAVSADSTSVASKAVSASKDSTPAESVYLEHKNVTAIDENPKANLTDLTPQEPSRSEPAESSVTTPPADAPSPEAAGTAAMPVDEDEQPTPPRLPEVSKSSNPPPEARPPEPQSPPARSRPKAAAAQSAAEPPPTLANPDWMPPPEDRVARFLNDVADIAPPPVRGREGSAVPGFVLPSSTSPEEVERKKAKAEPFWSQVVATPMEPSRSTTSSPRSRRAKRQRHLLRWLALAAAILLLVGIGLAVVITQHPELLQRL
jgi:hypothetical protein